MTKSKMAKIKYGVLLVICILIWGGLSETSRYREVRRLFYEQFAGHNGSFRILLGRSFAIFAWDVDIETIHCPSFSFNVLVGGERDFIVSIPQPSEKEPTLS